MNRLIIVSLSCFLTGTQSFLFSDIWCNRKYPPNFVVMLMDDVGWGDIGVYGNPAKETPKIDWMASKGMIFPDFYTGSPTCSPSRAAFLTGRLPLRNGLYTNVAPGRNSITLPQVTGGISDSEVLISEKLREKGYKSKFIGKWHLGHANRSFMPLQNGFDEFYGSMNNRLGPFDNVMFPNIPLFDGNKMLGRYYETGFEISNEGESEISQLFLHEALNFIEKSADAGDQFFLVWAPDNMHTRNYASNEFINKSTRGRYGDALMEADYGVGQILDTLKQKGIDKKTLVIFTSDNGGATYAGVDGGNNGPFLCGKFTNFEGGQRIPAIAYWPNNIKENSVSRRAATLMDFFATFMELAEIPMLEDREYDSYSLVDTLLKQNYSKIEPIFYYRGDRLYAVRYGQYKAQLWTWTNDPAIAPYNWDFCPGDFRDGVTTKSPTDHTAQPLLYHLGRDPGEQYMIDANSSEYKDEMLKINSIIDEHRANLKPGQPQLNIGDYAAWPWAPEGCEDIGQCLPVPPSNPMNMTWDG